MRTETATRRRPLSGAQLRTLAAMLARDRVNPALRNLRLFPPDPAGRW